MNPAEASSPRSDRTQKDENIISLILHVFRNLAYLTDRSTPASSASASAIEQSSLQSDLIASFSREGILDLLLAMSAHADSSDYAPWNMVVLDILHLLYRGVRADELMVPEKEVENTRLRELLDAEQKQGGREFALKGSRHSRFGTTIAVQSVRLTPLVAPSCSADTASCAGRPQVHPAQAVDALGGTVRDTRQDQARKSQKGPHRRRPRSSSDPTPTRGGADPVRDVEEVCRVGFQP